MVTYEHSQARQGPPFREPIRHVLRMTDRRLRRMTGRGNTALYVIVRRALTALAPIDSLSIAWFSDEHTAVLPYIFRDGEEISPEVVHFGPFSLPGTLLSTRRTYRFGEDRGRLLNSEIPASAGTSARRSRDAAAVPLPAIEDKLGGMITAESMVENVFDDEVVAAMEWLAKALVVAVGDHDSLRGELYVDHPELDSDRIADVLDLAHNVVWELDELSDLLAPLRECIDTRRWEDANRFVDRLGEAKSRIACGVVERARAASGPGEREPLTPRELQVAELIVGENLRNKEIGERLHISQKTVKAHVGSVLRKLGVQQREGIAWVLAGTVMPTRTR